jgi:hypothetical protein
VKCYKSRNIVIPRLDRGIQWFQGLSGFPAYAGNDGKRTYSKVSFLKYFAFEKRPPWDMSAPGRADDASTPEYHQLFKQDICFFTPIRL